MIGPSLRLHRERLKLSQLAVCKSVNISLRSYWGYENGKHEPPIAVARRIADLFGVTLDELTKEAA